MKFLDLLRRPTAAKDEPNVPSARATVAALEQALAEAQTDLAAKGAGQAALQAERKRALLDVPAKELAAAIAAIDARIAQSQLLLDQINAAIPELQSRLAEARREASQAELDKAVRDHDEIDEALARLYGEYETLSAKLVALLIQEEDLHKRQFSIRKLLSAAGVPHGKNLHLLARLSLREDQFTKALHTTVVLPAVSNAYGSFWPQSPHSPPPPFVVSKAKLPYRYATTEERA